MRRRGGKQAKHGKTTKNGGKRRKSRVTSLNSSFRAIGNSAVFQRAGEILRQHESGLLSRSTARPNKVTFAIPGPAGRRNQSSRECVRGSENGPGLACRRQRHTRVEKPGARRPVCYGGHCKGPLIADEIHAEWGAHVVQVRAPKRQRRATTTPRATPTMCCRSLSQSHSHRR